MKHTITVIFGSEACDYLDEHTVKGTIRKINKGDLEGMVAKYELDTPHDAEVLLQAIDDTLGWNDAWGYGEVKED